MNAKNLSKIDSNVTSYTPAPRKNLDPSETLRGVGIRHPLSLVESRLDLNIHAKAALGILVATSM